MGRICLVSPDVGPSIVTLSRQKWGWFTARIGRKLALEVAFLHACGVGHGSLFHIGVFHRLTSKELTVYNIRRSVAPLRLNTSSKRSIGGY